MAHMIYILFICISIPLCLIMPVLKGRSRLLILYMVIGTFVCMFAAEINSLLLQGVSNDMFYLTTTIAPITEEIVKALPVLVFAILVSDDRATLISISFAAGIGFAVLENTLILVQNIETVSIFWALIRGFASGLMHGICTMSIGLGISMIKKKRKLFYTGTFALLTTAIIYHASYNTLVQSQYRYFSFIMPLATYLPLVILLRKKERPI